MGKSWMGVIRSMKIVKTIDLGTRRTSWVCIGKKDTKISPRFSTKEEAGYWLVQFMGEQNEANKRVEGMEARTGVL